MTNRPQTHTINQDAREFGLHMRQGGWRLGLLVARNVAPAPGRVSPETLLPKVNATEFARRAGTSNDRVLRHLAAWERAANAGLVPHAATLNPGSEVDLDVDRLPAWGPIYNAPATPRTPARRAQTPPPSPVQTRTADPVVPPVQAPSDDTTDEDAAVNRALEAANERMRETMQRIRNNGGTWEDVAGRAPDPEAARSNEWQEDVRYAINAIAGHTRRLFDAARDNEWQGDRNRAAQDMLGLARQLQLIAEITVSPDKGQVTDAALNELMTAN